jgi:hypothetical protein
MSDVENPSPETADLMQGMTTGQFISSTFRSLLPGLVISVVFPLLIYNLLSPHYPATSIIPLALASLFPILGNVISIIRTRHLDIFGVLVFIGFIVSIIGVLLGGSQKLLLIRESFVTGAVGLVCLASLPFPRPLGYYFARQFLTGNDPHKVARFAHLWHYPSFRQTVRVLTVFWGCLLLGELLLRTVMALSLPVATVLAISPIVFNFLGIGGVVVTIAYGNLMRRRHQRRPEAAMPEHL